jgi:protein TonB
MDREMETRNSMRHVSERPGAGLRPSWLFPSLVSFVLVVHVGYFASGAYWPDPEIIPIASIDAQLLSEGDSVDAGVATLSGEEADAPTAPEDDRAEKDVETDLPEARESNAADVEKAAKKKPRVDKPKEPGPKRRANESAGQQGTGATGGTARVSGRFGAAAGRVQGAGGNMSCLAAVAASIHAHTPAATRLGPGRVMVTFYVNAGGGISGISTSGGSAEQGALARRIVNSSRGPSSCAPAYASQRISFD